MEDSDLADQIVSAIDSTHTELKLILMLMLMLKSLEQMDAFTKGETT